jgi:hypothetical protein
MKVKAFLILEPNILKKREKDIEPGSFTGKS